MEVRARLPSRMRTPFSGTFCDSIRNQPFTVGTKGCRVIVDVSAEIEPFPGTVKLRPALTAAPVSPKAVTVTVVGDAVGFVRTKTGSQPFPDVKGAALLITCDRSNRC